MASQRWRLREAALVATLLALAATGWALTAHWMRSMGAGPGSALGGLGGFVVSWLVMTAAMMLPATAPMVAEYGRRPAPAGATAAFAAGYLCLWGAVGLLAYAAIEVVRSLDSALFGWKEVGHYAGPAVIVAAGGYQLTTAKRACLRRCRERRPFISERWRTGRLGAVRMGIEHGGFCVGCCWALMAALLALGWMSLTWMVLIAALISAERLLPWGRLARTSVGVVLALLGIALLVAPEEAPGPALPEGAMDEHRVGGD